MVRKRTPNAIRNGLTTPYPQLANACWPTFGRGHEAPSRPLQNSARGCVRSGSMSHKRLAAHIDSLVAAVLLVALLPVLAVLAMAIVCESPGAVVVRRRARSESGQPVDLLTFRTTAASSARFTRVGRFLYDTCLDVLPSLWNVVVGEVRLVHAVRRCSPKTQA